MKTKTNTAFLISIFLLLAIFATAANAQQKYYKEIEKDIAKLRHGNDFSLTYKNDQTNVKLKFDLLKTNSTLANSFSSLSFAIDSIYVGPYIEQEAFMRKLCIDSNSKRFMFSSKRDLAFIINGKSLEYPPGERKTTLNRKSVNESLCWNLDIDTLSQLANARNANLLIGERKILLTNENIEAMFDFVNLLQIED